MKKVAVILGSKSDLPIAEKAFAVLREFGVPYEAHVYSAHRTPEEARRFATEARQNGFGVLIGIAGMAAHLAGALAASSTLPVIGVPVRGGAMDGLDALLATVQMPSGMPVATVALNGGANAALLAVQMLALEEPQLAEALAAARAKNTAAVLADDEALCASQAL